MSNFEISAGEGRARVNLLAQLMGDDLVIFIYNDNAHIGAVAVAEYDHKEERTSTSVITRLGHKDDVLAHKAACQICKHAKKPVCAVAGVHIDDITDAEINRVVENIDELVQQFINKGCGEQ